MALGVLPRILRRVVELLAAATSRRSRAAYAAWTALVLAAFGFQGLVAQVAVSHTNGAATRPESAPFDVTARYGGVAQRIVTSALLRNEGHARLLELCDGIGNRLSGSPALERAVILTSGDEIDVKALPAKVTERRAEPLVNEQRSTSNPTLEAIEKAYILWVLQSEGGNKSRAAEALGIDPSTLYRKLSRYGVEG